MLRSKLCMAMLVLATPMVISAQAIDQNAPVNNVNMAFFNQTNLAQSFKQTAGNITGAGIFLYTGYGSANSTLTIKLWDKLPNASGAALLATGTQNFSGNNQWVDVMWSPLGITAGQTYFLEFLESTNTYAIAGDTGNGYANGQVYANSGFESFPTFDYTFRTYNNGQSVVPEPSTWALTAAGLAGVMAVSRRRRKS